MKTINTNAGQTPHRGVSKVLLVGWEEFLFSQVSSHLFFGAHRARVAGKAVKLSEALPRLKSGAIDVVWLSRQFTPEDLLFFAADAKQSGYLSGASRATRIFKPNESHSAPGTLSSI